MKVLVFLDVAADVRIPPERDPRSGRVRDEWLVPGDRSSRRSRPGSGPGPDVRPAQRTPHRRPSWSARARRFPSPGSGPRLRPGDTRVGRRGLRSPDGGQGPHPGGRRSGCRVRPGADWEQRGDRLRWATRSAARGASRRALCDGGGGGGALGRFPPPGSYPRSGAGLSREGGNGVAGGHHGGRRRAGRGRRRRSGGRVCERVVDGARAGHHHVDARRSGCCARRGPTSRPTARVWSPSAPPPAAAPRCPSRSHPPRVRPHPGPCCRIGEAPRRTRGAAAGGRGRAGGVRDPPGRGMAGPPAAGVATAGRTRQAGEPR